MRQSDQTKRDVREKRNRQREAAFQERSQQQFAAFSDCFALVLQRATRKAHQLMEKDKLHYRWRSMESLVAQGANGRLATQICRHTEWLPEDCGRWLKQLGMEPDDVAWILNEVSKRRYRAAWAKVGGLKPGTRL